MLSRPAVTVLTLLIALVWTANVIVGFIAPERHDAALNGIFAVVVGGIFALHRKEKPHE